MRSEASGKPFDHEPPIPLLQHLVIGVRRLIDRVVHKHRDLRPAVIVRLGGPGEDRVFDDDHFVGKAINLVIILALHRLDQGQPVAEQLIDLAIVHACASPFPARERSTSSFSASLLSHSAAVDRATV
jgi:hypothetical protein